MNYYGQAAACGLSSHSASDQRCGDVTHHRLEEGSGEKPDGENWQRGMSSEHSQPGPGELMRSRSVAAGARRPSRQVRVCMHTLMHGPTLGVQAPKDVPLAVAARLDCSLVHDIGL